MAKIKTPTQPSGQSDGDQKIVTGGQEKAKKLSSPYSAPTVKEFLLVILVFAVIAAFSWIAYFKLGWFQ